MAKQEFLKRYREEKLTIGAEYMMILVLDIRCFTSDRMCI